jgi:hypothetical protein
VIEQSSISVFGKFHSFVRFSKEAGGLQHAIGTRAGSYILIFRVSLDNVWPFNVVSLFEVGWN